VDFARLKYKSLLLTKFASVQLIVQAIGFLSGILLVRTLDKQEYAYFTIANAMLGAMNVLADSGISIGLAAIGGKVWQDNFRFGQLINTALHLRRYLAVGAVVVVTPILLVMLIGKGAAAYYGIFITAVILASLFIQLNVGILSVIPRLKSHIALIQRLDLITAIFRLLLLIGCYYIYLNTGAAVLVALATFWLQYFLLRKWCVTTVDISAPRSAEDSAEIKKIIKSQFPNAVFYCIQGQLTIWLITIFGNTQSVAEVGALGRLGVLFAIIGSIMASIVLPAYSRCQSAKELRRKYLQIMSTMLSFSLLITLAALMFPDELLWVLGKQYAHLHNEVMLIVVNTVIASVATIMWSINSSKAWIQFSWLNIPMTIFTQTILLCYTDISSVKGVLIFSIYSSIPTVALNVFLAIRGLRIAGKIHTQNI